MTELFSAFTNVPQPMSAYGSKRLARPGPRAGPGAASGGLPNAPRGFRGPPGGGLHGGLSASMVALTAEPRAKGLVAPARNENRGAIGAGLSAALPSTASPSPQRQGAGRRPFRFQRHGLIFPKSTDTKHTSLLCVTAPRNGAQPLLRPSVTPAKPHAGGNFRLLAGAAFAALAVSSPLVSLAFSGAGAASRRKPRPNRPDLAATQPHRPPFDFSAFDPAPSRLNRDHTRERAPAPGPRGDRKNENPPPGPCSRRRRRRRRWADPALPAPSIVACPRRSWACGLLSMLYMGYAGRLDGINVMPPLTTQRAEGSSYG